MKKNRTMRAAALLLALTLMTSCFVGGTFAKYVSTATANDVARVAKWDIGYTDKTTANAKEVDITGTDEEIVFDLFNTVKEANTTTEEKDVKIGTNETIIAPGTGGAFALQINNNSEVTAKYSIELTEQNDNAIYIQYSLGDGVWHDDFTDINANTTYMKDVELDMETGAKEVTVFWRWAFESGNNAHAGQNDESDTLLGVLAQKDTKPSVTVTAKITATQVD